MHVKINRKVTFLSSTVGQKSQNIVVTHPSTSPIFCRHSLKLLSPTLPKLMNWILLSPPPLSSDPDPHPKKNLERALNVCSGGDLCSPFLTIETPCMKVGLDVRISLVKVLSTGGGGKLPLQKGFSLKKIRSYFKY